MTSTALSLGDDGAVASPGARALASVPGWRTVTVDPELGTIRVAGGVSLDLGATAKALAADRAATEASAAAGCGVLVSFGGDLAIAGPAPAEGWRIRVTDDHRSGFDAPGQWISLSSGGLATSSTMVRQWRTDTGTAHHLIDPLTGRSADSVWRTVSVCAEFVRGCEHREYRDDRPWREGGAVARGARAAEPARAHERHRPPRRRLALGRRRPAARGIGVCAAEPRPRGADVVSLSVGATLSPSAYWYLARGTGAVALVLLTASVVIGILGSVRVVTARWPRFAIDAVHRDVSLLVIVVLVIHIVTSVLDGFAPITLLDGVIPFVSPYRPLWLGLGTLAFDLLVAIAVTSLVRRRLGYRAWRTVHWLAYASWPVAVLHGLGTGSDVKQWWMLALTVICIVAVLAAVWTRIAHVSSDQPACARRRRRSR